MTNKEFLQQPMRIQKRIDALIIQKQSYEELADSTPGNSFDQPVVQTSKARQAPFIKWIDKIMEIDKRIAELQAEYEKMKTEVVQVIEKLPDTNHQTILIMRYLNDYPWPTICEKLYISLTTAKRWHFEAVNGIQI